MQTRVDFGTRLQCRCHSCLYVCALFLLLSSDIVLLYPLRLRVCAVRPAARMLVPKSNCTHQPSRPSLASPPQNPTPTSVSERPRHTTAATHTFFFPLRRASLTQEDTVNPGEVTPGIPASEYERRRRQLVDGLPDGSLVVCMAGHVKYMSAGEYYPSGDPRQLAHTVVRTPP